MVRAQKSTSPFSNSFRPFDMALTQSSHFDLSVGNLCQVNEFGCTYDIISIESGYRSSLSHGPTVHSLPSSFLSTSSCRFTSKSFKERFQSVFVKSNFPYSVRIRD